MGFPFSIDLERLPRFRIRQVAKHGYRFFGFWDFKSGNGKMVIRIIECDSFYMALKGGHINGGLNTGNFKKIVRFDIQLSLIFFPVVK